MLSHPNIAFTLEETTEKKQLKRLFQVDSENLQPDGNQHSDVHPTRPWGNYST